MRIAPTWSFAATMFCSISLFASAYEAVGGSLLLAGAGNPAAVESGLAGLASRLGAGATVPQVMAEAGGKLVSYSRPAPAPRLQRQRDWTLKDGDPTELSLSLSGILGLTDGKTAYKIKNEGWQDDNDKSFHLLSVGLEEDPAIIYTYKPADNSYAINWRTDVTGKLLITSYTDTSGTRIVPNATYSKQFEAQIIYWDAIVPPGTSVASNGSDS